MSNIQQPAPLVLLLYDYGIFWSTWNVKAIAQVHCATTIRTRLVQGPWQGPLASILVGPICTKLVGMWNKLGILCVCRMCLPRSIGDANEAGNLTVGSRTKWGKGTLIYCCFGDRRMLVYKISACEVFVSCQKPITACKIQYQSLGRRQAEPLCMTRLSSHPGTENNTGSDLKRKPVNVSLNIQPDCSTAHAATLSTSVCAGPSGTWDLLLHVSQII